MRRAGRLAARAVLALVLLASLGLTLWSGWRIASDPLLRPLVERAGDDLAAALERALARRATAEAIAARLTALLAEDPPNWTAIDGVQTLALDRGLTLPPDLVAALTAARDDASGFWAGAASCAACAFDATTCSLEQAVGCNLPVALTPAGDVIGLGRGAADWALGNDVDDVEVALSALGLTATVAAPATGGTSLTVKAGTSVIKLARRMALLSPRLLSLVTDTLRAGARADPAPLTALATDLGRLQSSQGAAAALHLLRHVDGPDDARRLADAATALGPRTLGAVEVLGKSRLLRAGLRLSDEAIALAFGLAGLLAALGTAAAGMVQARVLRALGRAATAGPRAVRR